MRPLHTPLLIAIVAGVVSCTTGCVGYLVGYGIDVGTRQVVVPTHPDSVDFKSGKKVNVILKSGERVSATFRRVEAFSEEEYAARYGASRQTLAARSLWVPPLGAKVDLVREDGDSLSAEFLGVDHNGLWVRAVGETQPRAVDARALPVVRMGRESFVSGAVLDSLVIAGTLPVRSSLVLEFSGKEEGRFPLNGIARMQRTGTTWRWVGSAVEVATWVVVCIAACEGVNYGLSP